MRKKVFLIISVLLLAIFAGCSKNEKVKVYDNTEDTSAEHSEEMFAGMVKEINLQDNQILFVDCITGDEIQLIYHGGVDLCSKSGEMISVESVMPGDIFDVGYYADTTKIVSMHTSPKYKVMNSVNKLIVDKDRKTARYSATTCKISENILAFDGDIVMDVSEINTEDLVTLCFYGDVLMGVRVEVGHGYVRLVNHETYIGGMVEIGYDVIVPVTEDMLVAVREGEYTLRINKGGYSDSKTVKVKKGEETEVNIADIAIPTGTVIFDIDPIETDIYVNGNKLEGYSYSNLYGAYNLKLEAEGYKSFYGSFNIKDPAKTIKLKLNPAESTEETTEEEQTTEAGTSTTEATSQTTEEGGVTESTITVKAPVGAGVYVDGDYVGIAPVTFPKKVGTHTIILYQSGYLIKSYTVYSSDDGKDQEFEYPALTSLSSVITE